MEDLVLPYDEIDRLREDVRFGYAEAVRTSMEANKARSVPKPLSRYSALLAEAIRHRHDNILEVLLSEGIPVTASAVKVAAEGKSTRALSVLIGHGWEINKPLSASEPPMLRCVYQYRWRTFSYLQMIA